MARARNIKPSFFINDTLAESNCPLGRLLFIGMWTIADCNGNFEWRPARIKAQVLPYDECDIKKLAINLDKSGFIRFYSVGDKIFVNIPTFLDHQNPHKNEREKGGSVAEYSDNGRQLIDLTTLTINRDKSGAEPEDSKSNPADSPILNPDSCSLNPDCGNGAGAPDGGKPPTAKTITKTILVNEFSVDPQVAADYLQVRKAKKSPLTPTAWESLTNEFSKAGLAVPDGVRLCVVRGWVGFKASWDWKDGDTGKSDHSGFENREYTSHIPEWAQEGQQ